MGGQKGLFEGVGNVIAPVPSEDVTTALWWSTLTLCVNKTVLCHLRVLCDSCFVWHPSLECDTPHWSVTSLTGK